MNFLNRFKYARDSYLFTILIVAIVVMINFIASRHFFRVDLTKNQLYAISPASKTMMRELKDIVDVKIFFSDQLPPNLFVVRQYVQDILGELESYSKGNLAVEFLNPDDPTVRNQALQLGIPQIQMNIIEKDKLEVKNGFLGVAVTYGDHTEILPVVQNILNVEYDLVSAVKKVTATETRVVGFLTGHGEPSLGERVGIDQPQQSFTFLKQALEKNYTLKSINLSNGDTLENVNTLLIAGSKTSFDDREKYAIDQFLVSGGNVILLLDAVDVADNLETTVLDRGLDEWLESYGVKIEKAMVLDRSNERASFNQGFTSFILSYPYWVKAVRPNFSALSPITAKMDSLVLPWTGPVSPVEHEGIVASVLVSSTESAWLRGEPFNLDPSLIQSADKQERYPLAILLEGQFTSYFSEKKDLQKNGFVERSEKSGRIVAVGNSRFATDRFAGYGQNLSFVMNTVDYLTLDESLIGIRSKNSIDLPLRELSVYERQMVKYVGILLMPALVVLFGIFRLIVRRRRKPMLS